MSNLFHEKNFPQFECEDGTCEVGHIGSSNANEDMVIFLDGDVSNHEEENIIDIDYFRAAYTYEDFLEDFLFRDRLLGAVERLNKKIIEIQKLASSQVGTSATQSNNDKDEEYLKM